MPEDNKELDPHKRGGVAGHRGLGRPAGTADVWQRQWALPWKTKGKRVRKR